MLAMLDLLARYNYLEPPVRLPEMEGSRKGADSGRGSGQAHLQRPRAPVHREWGSRASPPLLPGQRAHRRRRVRFSTEKNRYRTLVRRRYAA